MHRLLLRNLVYSLIFILFASCKIYRFGEVKSFSATQKTVENSYFSSNKDYVYKCQMDIYKNHVSGIVIIKKISETAHRVVMTTDFGNKMFDFEISQIDFKLNYVLPDLNKKMIINFLKNDFRALLRQKYDINESFTDEKNLIFTSIDQNTSAYLFYDNTSDLFLKKIILTKNNQEKINFIFEAKSPTFAEKIKIQHKDFKINIRLLQITENETE